MLGLATFLGRPHEPCASVRHTSTVGEVLVLLVAYVSLESDLVGRQSFAQVGGTQVCLALSQKRDEGQDCRGDSDQLGRHVVEERLDRATHDMRAKYTSHDFA